MDVAFIQDAKDQIDHDQRRKDQERYGAQRLLERLRGALETRAERGWPTEIVDDLQDGIGGLAERYPLGEVEADGGRRKLTLVGDRERAHWDRRPLAEHRK